MRFEVDDLVSGVNAGIGSTGTHDLDRMIGNSGEGRLEIALNRGQAFVLELKAVEGRASIGNDQRDRIGQNRRLDLFEQLVGLGFLRLVTLCHDFVQHVAGTVGVAHVDVGASQIELGAGVLVEIEFVIVTEIQIDFVVIAQIQVDAVVVIAQIKLDLTVVIKTQVEIVVIVIKVQFKRIVIIVIERQRVICTAGSLLEFGFEVSVVIVSEVEFDRIVVPVVVIVAEIERDFIIVIAKVEFDAVIIIVTQVQIERIIIVVEVE